MCVFIAWAVILCAFHGCGEGRKAHISSSTPGAAAHPQQLFSPHDDFHIDRSSQCYSLTHTSSGRVSYVKTFANVHSVRNISSCKNFPPTFPRNEFVREQFNKHHIPISPSLFNTNALQFIFCSRQSRDFNYYMTMFHI